MTSLFRLLLCLFATLGATASFAEPVARIQGLVLDADDFFRDTDSETIELSGNVQIVSQDRHIQADKAVIRLRSSQVELNGRVRITTSGSTLGGDRIILDYESGTGLIYNGYVQSGPVIFEGAVIQKTAEDEYFVLEANYTACTNCPASWSFQGSSIRAELGGYAYIKNSLLKVGTVPVMWLPYLVVPLKSDRQSGLLTPGFERSSTGGWAIAQPYFWAISRSTDATLTVKNYELRGTKALTNYRYVLDEYSEGELDVGLIRDRAFQIDDRITNSNTPDQDSPPLNRWFLRYKHYQELPEGWVHRATLNNASDLQYPKDFPDETPNHGDPSMESRWSMTKNTDDTHFSVDSSYHINLLQADPLAGTDDSVHRLPEIRFAKTPTLLGASGLYYTFDLNFANFVRSGPAYDDLSLSTPDASGRVYRYVTNTCGKIPTYEDGATCSRVWDGSYDPATDLLRTGQRLDLQPSLFFPISLGNSIDLLPRLSYRETHYNFQAGDETNNVRRYLRTELAGRISFSRVYGDLADPKGTRYKHEIRPELRYTALPWIDHKSHPFFGFSQQTEAPTFENLSVTDEDLAGSSGLQFDYRDRIYDRNLLTYSVVNTITEKQWVNEAPAYKQVALVRLSQSYDAWKDSQSDPKKQPWSDISLSADLQFNRVQSAVLVQYFPYQKVANVTGTRVRVNDELGRFAEVGMNKAYVIVSGEEVDRSRLLEDYSFAGGLISRYVNLMGKFTYDARTSDESRKIKSSTYIAQLKPPGDCWLVTFIYNQITGGDTNFRLNFEFTFDGVPRPPLPPEALDSYGF